MDGVRLDGFSQRSTTIRSIRECSCARAGCRAPHFLYSGVAHCHVEEFFEDQRSVFFAGEASDD
jgi:hypothetical protein